MTQLELMRIVVGHLEALRIPYFVTGSMASMHYGEYRMTLDIDIVAELTPESAERLCKQFSAQEFYASHEAARDAAIRRSQFNIIHVPTGLKVDVIPLKETRYDFNRIERIIRHRVDEKFEAFFAAPEDIIIKKMEYYREGGHEKHLRDIATMLKVSDKVIDREYIARWAGRLNLLDLWQTIVERVDRF